MHLKLLAGIIPLVLVVACGVCADIPVQIGSPPIISITTAFAGANADVVASSVADPIEQQVSGVEGVRHLLSQCTNDGKYVLNVVFKAGVDPGKAQVQVQNRVKLAKAILPDAVQKTGVTVKKLTSKRLLTFVALSSPRSTFDDLYLSRCADINVKGELARIPGIADITCLGQSDVEFRIILSLERLRARNLTPSNIIDALKQQNAQPGKPGPADKEKEIEIALKALARLKEATELEEMIVKAEVGGLLIRLRDVARVEVGRQDQGSASLNGKPAAILGVYVASTAPAGRVDTELRKKLAELGTRLPVDITLETGFGFTAHLDAADSSKVPAYLLLDPVLPLGARTGRVREFLDRAAAILREIKDVKDVLILPDNPFDLFGGRPCMLVRLAPAGAIPAGREQIVQRIRTRLDKIPDGKLRVRDLSGSSRFPSCSYPIDFAIHGPDGKVVRQLADKLADRLRQSKKLADVAASTAYTPGEMIYFDIHRAAARARGVEVAAILDTIQAFLGVAQINDFKRSGLRLTVQGDSREIRGRIDDLKKLTVRNRDGKMVALADLASVGDMIGTALVERYNGSPMVGITANPAAGVSVGEARALSQRLAEEVRKELGLPKEYRLSWLQEATAAK
jgi:multidrug efflux pump subunit AcrB